MNDLTKNILLWIVIILVLLVVFSRYMPSVGQPEEVRYSTFLSDVNAQRVESVVLQGEMIYGVRKDKSQFKTFNPETDYTALIGALQKQGLEALDLQDKPFDPSLAEAVAHEPGSDEVFDGPVVVETLRTGYRWKGKVLRPAMVRTRG